MPTKTELETALVNAHNAGDTAAATQLANAIKNGEYSSLESRRQRAIEETQLAVEPERRAGRAFGRAALGQYVENLLNVPNALLQLHNIGRVPLAEDGIGIDPEWGQAGFIDRTRMSMESAPRIPVPDREQIFAYTGVNSEEMREGDFSSVGEIPQRLNEEEVISASDAVNHPLATALGEGVGTAATLLSGRAPLAVGSRNARMVNGMADETLSGLSKAAPGFRRLANQIWDSAPVQKLNRGLNRAVGTGYEGAVVAMLEGGDPIEMGAYSAGAQMAGSMSLTLFPKTKKGLVGFASMIAGLTAFHRQSQEFSTASESIFDAVDFAFDKTALFITLGAVSAFTGMGRVPNGAIKENLPVVAEAITQLPRGAVLSFIHDMSQEEKDGTNTTSTVMEKLMRDPDYFGPQARNRIERALMSETQSISAVIDELMQGRAFQDKFDEIN